MGSASNNARARDKRQAADLVIAKLAVVELCRSRRLNPLKVSAHYVGVLILLNKVSLMKHLCKQLVNTHMPSSLQLYCSHGPLCKALLPEVCYSVRPCLIVKLPPLINLARE